MGSPGARVGWGLLDYKTEKYVMTRNWRVGALQRLLQLGVVVYVVGKRTASGCAGRRGHGWAEGREAESSGSGLVVSVQGRRRGEGRLSVCLEAGAVSEQVLCSGASLHPSLGLLPAPCWTPAPSRMGPLPAPGALGRAGGGP